jgi:hypothetical protein
MRMTQDHAILTFDSLAAPRPNGIRHGHSDVRHLVYKGSILEITLQVNTNSTSMTIVGQLAAGPGRRIVPDARVCLIGDHNSRMETRSDPGGQFMFEKIPTHSYSVEISYDDVGVTIDRVPPPKVEPLHIPPR